METGEKALAIAVLNQALNDFTEGCKMYSEARKSLEKKGTLPSGYGTINTRFNESADFFTAKTRGHRLLLILWTELADSDPDVMSSKFKAVLRGEGKLGAVDYYENIRDKWVCDAYLHNDKIIKEEGKLRIFKKGSKDYNDCETKIKALYKETEFFIRKNEEKICQLEEKRFYANNPQVLNEKIKDLELINKIYREKSTGNKHSNIVYKYEENYC